MSLKLPSVFLLFSLTLITPTLQSNPSTKIRTPTATFIGSRLTIENFPSIRPSSTVDEFLGIRYGLAPTGARRFGKSVPAWIPESSKNQKVPEIKALSWAPSCMQQPGFTELNLQTTERSEDCLFLNLWVPNSGSKSSEPKPVLVWFHGGSFISESASRKLYFGAHLATTADSIIVTVNYRVDAFGFAYSGKLNGTEAAVGNQALWDQLLALEWVQEHIQYFGGDPRRVTIGGHNSGATSVGLHLLSEQSRRFFTRALMISGSVFSQLVNSVSEKKTEVSALWAEAATKISCGSSPHWTIETFRCVQKASTDDLLKLLDPFGAKSLSPEIILGDQLFPFGNILSGIEDLGKSKPEIQVLLGSTDDEGSLVLPLMDMKTYSLLEPKKLSKNEAFQELRDLSEKLVVPKGSKAGKINGDEVARHYVNPSSGSNYQGLIGSALGDFYVSCPVVEFANRLAAVLGPKAVFQYVWSRKVDSREVPCVDWMGACHGSDVVMLFGAPFQERDQYTSEDRKVSVKFMETIGQFIRDGKPAKQEGKEWPSFTSAPNAASTNVAPFYEFSSRPSAGAGGGSRRIYHQNWKRDLCADLWRKYLIPSV